MGAIFKSIDIENDYRMEILFCYSFIIFKSIYLANTYVRWLKESNPNTKMYVNEYVQDELICYDPGIGDFRGNWIPAKVEFQTYFLRQ